MLSPSPSRIEAVIRATKKWQRELVDTSGRNRLRRYRDLRTGTLDLTPGRARDLNERGLDRLLAGWSVNLTSLFPEARNDPDDVPAFNDARRRLATIHKMALTNSEEKGIETLFAAIGLATWKVESGSPPNAPRGPYSPPRGGNRCSRARDFKLELSGDAHLNPVLTHILRTDHDIGTDDDEADVAEDPPASYKGFLALLDRLKSSWKVLPDLKSRPGLSRRYSPTRRCRWSATWIRTASCSRQTTSSPLLPAIRMPGMPWRLASATPSPISPTSTRPRTNSLYSMPTQASTWRSIVSWEGSRSSSRGLPARASHRP